MPTREQLWADFTGRNHCELAIKYRLPIQTVYRWLHLARIDQQRNDEIKRLLAHLDDPAANVGQITTARVYLARLALAATATRLSLHQLWRQLGSLTFFVLRSGLLHVRLLAQPLKTLVRRAALQALVVVRSLHSPYPG